MQIRRYTGPELPEVLDRIGRDLGPNAAIINTRQIHQGGFFGVMRRRVYEVTVAVDNNLRLRESGPVAAPGGAGLRSGGALPAAGRIAAGGPPPGGNRFMSAGLTARQELSQMKVSAAPASLRYDAGNGLSEELERVHRSLVRNQVEADISRQLLRVFDEQLSLMGEDWSRARPRFERYLAGMIRANPGIQLREGRKPLVVMFIGPTGVGKTTTIAKVATHFALIEHRRVGIITADTYRLGATDQMRRYGEILGVPVKVVETPEELEPMLPQFSGYDLVLIDTAGRSPRNREQIVQMKQLVESARPDEIHLVMSMTTKYVDVISIISLFGIVPLHKVVLTKCDETRTFGLILNISMKFSMEVAYITTGQQVPDDIEPADATRLAKLVLNGVTEGNGRPGFPSA